MAEMLDLVLFGGMVSGVAAYVYNIRGFKDWVNSQLHFGTIGGCVGHCTAGYHLVTSSCTCVPDGCTKTCQAGQHVSSTCTCVPDTNGGGGGGGATGQTDSDGIKTPFQLTGKAVKVTGFNAHANGDRYSQNHKFQNYFVVGYYKNSSGSGHRLIEMKTDGPNHGSSTGTYNCGGGGNLPNCEWVELDFDVSNGTPYISSEWPHPVNHPRGNEPNPFPVNFKKNIPGNYANKWVGFGIAAYWVGKYRQYEMWIDPTGLNASGRPNNNWVLALKHLNNNKVIIPDPARKLPTGGAGLEAEIRMNDQHNTSAKFNKILEISGPLQSSYAISSRVSYLPSGYNPRFGSLVAPMIVHH